jgi:NAD(P)H-hydrate epimerase
VGLLAQGVPPYEAAMAGAYLHAHAGELAARALGTPASVMASDVLEGLAEALAELA